MDASEGVYDDINFPIFAWQDESERVYLDFTDASQMLPMPSPQPLPPPPQPLPPQPLPPPPQPLPPANVQSKVNLRLVNPRPWQRRKCSTPLLNAAFESYLLRKKLLLVHCSRICNLREKSKPFLNLVRVSPNDIVLDGYMRSDIPTGMKVLKVVQHRALSRAALNILVEELRETSPYCSEDFFLYT